MLEVWNVCVEHAIDGLIGNGPLRSRDPDTPFNDVLTEALMEDIYEKAIKHNDCLPVITRASQSWNQATIFLLLLHVLQTAHGNTSTDGHRWP